MIATLRFCKQFTSFRSCKLYRENKSACADCCRMDTVMVPVCDACGEEILEDEVIEAGGSHYHKGCIPKEELSWHLQK